MIGCVRVPTLSLNRTWKSIFSGTFIVTLAKSRSALAVPLSFSLTLVLAGKRSLIASLPVLVRRMEPNF